MEHPDPVAGSLATADPHALLTRLRHVNLGEDGFATGVCLSEAVQEREGLLNSSLRLRYHAPDDVTAILPQVEQRLRAGDLDLDLARDLWRVVSEPDIVAYNALRRGLLGLSLIPRPEKVEQLEFVAQVEQAPNPESRVVLTAERDALGMRRVGLDWRITDLDKRTLRRNVELLGAELARLGLGVMRMEPWLEDPSPDWGDTPNGGFHHMGRTRMSADPRSGVVDPDCRVHGMENLYAASCAVFPTCGYINPTFTIVALAIRLADHLKFRTAA